MAAGAFVPSDRSLDQDVPELHDYRNLEKRARLAREESAEALRQAEQILARLTVPARQ